MIDVKIQ
jgi:hypothetical protein